MARCYPGTVMLEGTTLSEGRGTTRPLELFGAPGAGYPGARRAKCSASRRSGLQVAGCAPCWFEPTFHKHHGQLCAGLHVHVEDARMRTTTFRPWRLQALAFKALRNLQPDYPLWRDFAYEYENGRLAIDLINGGPALREWVDDRCGHRTATSMPSLRQTKQAWREQSAAVLVYR